MAVNTNKGDEHELFEDDGIFKMPEKISDIENFCERLKEALITHRKNHTDSLNTPVEKGAEFEFSFLSNSTIQTLIYIITTLEQLNPTFWSMAQVDEAHFRLRIMADKELIGRVQIDDYDLRDLGYPFDEALRGLGALTIHDEAEKRNKTDWDLINSYTGYYHS